MLPLAQHAANKPHGIATSYLKVLLKRIFVVILLRNITIRLPNFHGMIIISMHLQLHKEWSLLYML